MNRFQRPTARNASVYAILGLLIAPEVWAADAGVWAELAKSQTLSATFTQVQYRTVLKAPLTSTGTVRFSRPQTLDWVVDAPARSSFTLQDGVATMAYPDLGIREVIDLKTVPEASQLATSLLVWMQADAALVERDFSVVYTAKGAVLTPKGPTLAALLARIELTLVPGPWRVTQVVLREPDGDRVEIVFSEIVLG